MFPTYEQGFDDGYEAGFEDATRAVSPSSPYPSTQGVPAREVATNG